jgi:3-hydroxyacyl-[acyl-carrier-protein] dehydratase
MGKASHRGHGGHRGGLGIGGGQVDTGTSGVNDANWGKHLTEDTRGRSGVGCGTGAGFVYFPSPVRLRRLMNASEAMDPISLGLPHRPPFIFVESVDKLEAGALAHCSKTFRRSESFFEGHFPGNAMVPGVLLVEGMAQTAGIAVGGPNKFFLLSAIRSMKFLRPVRPEEPIGFSARKLGAVGGLVQCAVEARVGEQLIAEGQIILTEVLSAQSLPE